MDTLTTAPKSHGGLLFPLDMFRPTMLAAAIAEVLIAKVRNIVDARLEIARHPHSPLALARIHGTVIGDDAAEFWRSNLDIALVASQIIPRQCFVYYARGGEKRREGFLVAQRGQALAADDSDQHPSGQHWPVTRLVEQMRTTLDDLGDGFPGGPRIEIALMEPRGNDQTLLMTLIGQNAAGAAGEEPEDDLADEPPPPPPPSRSSGLTQGFTAPPTPGSSPASAPQAASGPRPGKPPSISAADDAKRRASEKAAELQALQERSESAAKNLRFVEDERGVVVALAVELAESALLHNYVVPVVEGSLPEGLPRSLQNKLHGKSIDFAVPVEFFSEVFVDNQPLNRPKFEERAQELRLGDTTVKGLEVLAPRLGNGMLLRLGSRNVFVSRRAGAPLPADLLLELLRG